MKLVHSIQDEKEFHVLLKKKFPEFIVELRIGNYDKDETYIFDIELYKIFLNYVDKGDFSSKELLIEEETNTILNDYFENIEERYENELLLKLKPTIDITKILTIQQNEYAIDLNKRYYDYLELKKNIDILKL
jgi:hypothetical protein